MSKITKELFARKCINYIKKHLFAMAHDKDYSVTTHDLAWKLFGRTIHIDKFRDYFYEAVGEVRDQTDGKLNFRWDSWLNKHRWFITSDDAIQITHQQKVNIQARKESQMKDYDLLKNLHPDYEKSIVILDVPSIDVSPLQIVDIKERHEKLFDGDKK